MDIKGIIASSISEQVNGVASGDSAEKHALGIVQMIIMLMGIVAVIAIILGGVNYIMSQGDPGKVKKAKDTILYSAIGLAVVVLAYAIVTFIMTRL